MKKASDFRYANILPAALIDEFAGKEVKAVRFSEDFHAKGKYLSWYEYEKLVYIDFKNSENNDNQTVIDICTKCGGQCCKNIPDHQIGIYMSDKELLLAENKGHKVKIQGSILVDDIVFYVLDVNKDGDCKMLTPTGCSLGNDKPLWCKIYHCPKFLGNKYIYEENP